MTSLTQWRRTVATTAVLSATLVVGGIAGVANPAAAADNPYQRGPDPTRSSIQAARGSFAVSQTSVSRYGVSGFGGGTVYYPTDQSQGTFGAVVVAPGYTARQSSMAWLGPRIASQGFVVFTIDTITVYDQPASRGDQLLAAADYLTQRSAVAGRIDATRVAVVGHSMGGGGTLEAAKDRPSLKAAIPLTPWNIDKTWPEVTTPTLVIGARERHRRAGRVAREAVLPDAPVVDAAHLPRAARREPLRAEHLEHDDRRELDRLAQAVRRQRHPLHAVPVPDPVRGPRCRRPPPAARSDPDRAAPRRRQSGAGCPQRRSSR